MDEEVSGRDVFEAAAAAFCERGAEGAGDNDVVRGFGKDGFSAARDVRFGGG